jgi:hypothetical protein
MGNDEKPSGSVSFGEALVEVVKNLKDQPPLLFVLGIAILVFGAGTIAFENLRMIIGSLLILTVVGLSVWLFIEAQKRRHESESQRRQLEHERVAASKAKGGSIDVENVHNMTGDSLQAGKAHVKGPGSAEGGDIKISGVQNLRGSNLTAGDASVENQTSSHISNTKD